MLVSSIEPGTSLIDALCIFTFTIQLTKQNHSCSLELAFKWENSLEWKKIKSFGSVFKECN